MDIKQQAWIDYNAMSGLITDNTEERPIKGTNDTSTMRKMPIIEFAQMIDVSRETLRQWRNSIPDFWQKVNDRRHELAPTARLQKMHEVWYLSALNPKNFQDRQLWLANFDPNFRMPTQKLEHEAGGGLADLLELGRKRERDTNRVVEAEVVSNDTPQT